MKAERERERERAERREKVRREDHGVLQYGNHLIGVLAKPRVEKS